MTPDKTRSTNRKPTEVRRREIAAAVLRLIGERGAPALTAASIAEAVGVTPGALFRHFESVDAILLGAVELAVELVEATFPDPDLPPCERLQALLTARIAAIRETPGLAWLLLSDQVFLSVPPLAVDHLRGLVERSRTFLRNALKEAVADGDLRDDVDLSVMLVLFTGTVHTLAAGGGVHASPSGRRRPRQPQPTRVLETLLELLAPQ